MSKKCQKEIRQHLSKVETTTESIYSEFNENVALDIVVGSSNIMRWKELKTILCCNTNTEFATVLLNLAKEHVKRLVFLVSYITGKLWVFVSTS